MEEILKNNTEQETSEIEEKPVSNETEKVQEQSQDKNVVSALDKEIQRRKKELYELSEVLRKTKEENQSIVEKLRKENLDITLKELSEKYSISEEEKEKIISELNSKYPDVLTKDKLLDLSVGIYYSLNPNKIKELENKITKSEEMKNELTKQQISSSSTYQPSVEDDLTPEEREIVARFGVNPEIVKKTRDKKSGFSISDGGVRYTL